MSKLLQQAYAPDRAQIVSVPTWSDCGSPGTVSPLLDRTLALAGVGVWSCNVSDSRLSWTSGVYEIFGLPADAAPDRRQATEMYTDDSREAMERVRAQAVARGGTFAFDAQIVRPDGDLRWMRVTGELIRAADGTPVLHGLKQDVTAEKQRLEALRRLAENDALTGLANRAAYENRFLDSRSNGSPVVPLCGLILFDLDGFKGINDRFGHSAGDACLRAFAERLSASFPDALLTARIGGDEFAVLVGECASVDQLEARVDRFQVQLRTPVLWREHMLTVAATSGIAVPADSYCYDPEELFVRADAALYAKKGACRRARASDRF